MTIMRRDVDSNTNLVKFNFFQLFITIVHFFFPQDFLGKSLNYLKWEQSSHIEYFMGLENIRL